MENYKKFEIENNLDIQEENNKKFDTLLDGILANNINNIRKDDLNQGSSIISL